MSVEFDIDCLHHGGMSQTDDYLLINRANWDSRVPLHLQGYDLDRFRSDPNFISKVVAFDQSRLPEIRGLRGLHLQCHIGTDTVSLSRLGASMTGLDFSPAAIQAARALDAELKAGVTYVQGEVYRAVEALRDAKVGAGFDFIYTGIGALCWLPNIRQWASVVRMLLKPGGFLFLREGHPMLWSVGESRPDGVIEILYDYFEGRGIAFEETHSYEGTGEVGAPLSISFNHGLAEIFNALWREGFHIEVFEEHDSVPWNPLADEFEPVADTGEWRLKENPRRLAASYTLVARCG